MALPSPHPSLCRFAAIRGETWRTTSVMDDTVASAKTANIRQAGGGIPGRRDGQVNDAYTVQRKHG